MKKLGRIKLNQLSKVELEQRKMNALRGGCDCRYTYYCSGCSCQGSASETYVDGRAYTDSSINEYYVTGY